MPDFKKLKVGDAVLIRSIYSGVPDLPATIVKVTSARYKVLPDRFAGTSDGGDFYRIYTRRIDDQFGTFFITTEADDADWKRRNAALDALFVMVEPWSTDNLVALAERAAELAPGEESS